MKVAKGSLDYLYLITVLSSFYSVELAPPWLYNKAYSVFWNYVAAVLTPINVKNLESTNLAVGKALNLAIS